MCTSLSLISLLFVIFQVALFCPKEKKRLMYASSIFTDVHPINSRTVLESVIGFKTTLSFWLPQIV